MSGPHGFRRAPSRPPAVAAECMVATSHPLAAAAGLRAMASGGNAVDAALAGAAALCVAEPMSTGIGGDAFAIVWDGGELHGLDAAGPAPALADPGEPVARTGPRSVTVPGAVAGWGLLSDRFGKLGLDRCLAAAIHAAEHAVAVGHVSAASWAKHGGPRELGPAPEPGGSLRLPELGATLRRIADAGPDAFYRGPVARAIAGCSWLSEEDLADYEPRWVQPLEVDYLGVTVAELPPPTQGVAALEALALLALGEQGFGDAIECVRLALEDAALHVRDGADVTALLDRGRLEARRGQRSAPVSEPSGGTSYICAIDADGMAVSFIQSLYESFGSGLVAPGTGVVLQNRAACFAVSGTVEPGRRPYHTIIPAMLLESGRLLGPLGLVGGFMQAQGHVQVVSSLIDGGLDPQAALDMPRFRVEGDEVRLEDELWERRDEVEALGLTPVRSNETRADFGCGQLIVANGSLSGGSDARGDGCAIGW